MTTSTIYRPFPKITRFSREVWVSEKIDGTNAQIVISDDGTEIQAGSRTRWITTESDNFGFAAWVQENKSELLKLGPGVHAGEWFGRGIQRTYGLTERRFALFNVSRWSDDKVRPSCCHVVPVLWRGNFDALNAGLLVENLRVNGSVAVPGYTKPEGIIIFHTASGTLFKKTLEKDDSFKGEPDTTRSGFIL